MSAPRGAGAEWPTLAALALCYGTWGMGTSWLAGQSLLAAICLTAVAVALFSSLQHEILHGHPFRNTALNTLLASPGLTLFIPYLRFRDSHLDHHGDIALTDPYDDPESNYLDPAVWARLPGPVRLVLVFNNTLLGRLIVGAAVSEVAFLAGDLRAARAGDARVIRGWLWHVPAVALVLWWLLAFGQLPLWAYLIAAYAGLSLIKIRTFLEHQAHRRAPSRTVIIEDNGPLAWLFLYNNLHVVHHGHPRAPWYRLPALYAAGRDRYRAQNGGYVYRSYAQIFRKHLLRTKDPVPHPFWP